MFDCRVFAAALVSLLLAACATGSDFEALPQPGSDEAVFYAYRVPALQHAGVTPNLFLGEKDLGTMVGGGYVALKLRPGIHRFSLACTSVMRCQFSERSFAVAVQAGQTVYYRYTVSVSHEGGRSLIVHSLLPAPADEGRAEIVSMKKIVP